MDLSTVLRMTLIYVVMCSAFVCLVSAVAMVVQTKLVI